MRKTKLANKFYLFRFFLCPIKPYALIMVSFIAYFTYFLLLLLLNLKKKVFNASLFQNHYFVYNNSNFYFYYHSCECISWICAEALILGIIFIIAKKSHSLIIIPRFTLVFKIFKRVTNFYI